MEMEITACVHIMGRHFEHFDIASPLLTFFVLNG